MAGLCCPVRGETILVEETAAALRGLPMSRGPVPASLRPADSGGSYRAELSYSFCASEGEAPGPDTEDCTGIMLRCRRALGAGIEGNGGPDVLVAEELANDLVLPRVAVEEDLADSMPEAMRRHVEPCVGVDQLLDLAAQGPFAFMMVGSFAGEQEGAGSGKQHGSNWAR